MNIHLQRRKGFQDRLSQGGVDLIGIHGIALLCSFRLHLEGKISFRMHVSHIIHHPVLQIFKSIVVELDHGTDARDAEHILQMSDHLVKIKADLRFQIDPSGFLADPEVSFHVPQGEADLSDQRVLEQIVMGKHITSSCICEVPAEARQASAQCNGFLPLW